MPVPKQRHTKSHRNRRRSHMALKTTKLASCKKCGQSVLPHRVCLNCGVYDGRQVIDVMAKLDKKAKKQKAKELSSKEHKH